MFQYISSCAVHVEVSVLMMLALMYKIRLLFLCLSFSLLVAHLEQVPLIVVHPPSDVSVYNNII